ncbi:LytTR family transcriptional regulator DNA-binding domain-containing protein [Acholeplasma equirhinis]|uniref:LytR/AlgR family response regulator transcription factor n=1 Tax=Acholeplasma equirhinis TaxID=555393 RepID=UPI00197AD4A2|nr:LytTR family DNA-binding domain-containing protein [Acholeplasma equirhinis]MBN3489900.1 LytTR family transcriptional regulator DNA-binding domain-containing protein [Acholeplasma equirhinis]
MDYNQGQKFSSNEMFLNFAICEDQQEDIKKCIDLLDQATLALGYKYKVSTFNSGDALLFNVSETPSMYEIIFMDIQLINRNGVDIARKLRELGSISKIIFFTSTEDYVYEAFDVKADNYIVKSRCTLEKFTKILDQTIKHIEEDKNKLFFFEFKGNRHVVSLNKIQYFEVWNKVITIHFDNKVEKFYSNLQDVLSKLNQIEFFQVHRSYIVNLNYITKVYKNEIILKDGSMIPLGKTYMESFENHFMRFINKVNFFEQKVEMV